MVDQILINQTFKKAKFIMLIGVIFKRLEMLYLDRNINIYERSEKMEEFWQN